MDTNQQATEEALNPNLDFPAIKDELIKAQNTLNIHGSRRHLVLSPDPRYINQIAGPARIFKSGSKEVTQNKRLDYEDLDNALLNNNDELHFNDGQQATPRSDLEEGQMSDTIAGEHHEDDGVFLDDSMTSEDDYDIYEYKVEMSDRQYRRSASLHMLDSKSGHSLADASFAKMKSQPFQNLEVQKRIERKERKLRLEKLRQDPKRQRLVEDGKTFLHSIQFFNPALQFQNKTKPQQKARAQSDCSSEVAIEEIPAFDPRRKQLSRWKKDVFDKVTEDKRDRVFLTTSLQGGGGVDKGSPSKDRPPSPDPKGLYVKNSRPGGFLVSKVIPYQKKRRFVESSSSSSNSNQNSFDSVFSSLVYSSSDTDHEHISTPSDNSSGTSQDQIENKSEEEQLNKRKMLKKERFPRIPLYLDDSQLGQGKYMHIIQLQSYRMSLLPYVSAESRKDELNRQFRINFPRIRKALTLSKLRRLKMDMVKIFLQTPTMLEEFTAALDLLQGEVDPAGDKDQGEEAQESEHSSSKGNRHSYVELYTLAVAWILFETLVQRKLVKKHNRRSLLCTCILISFKQIQVFGGYEDNDLNKALFEQLGKDMQRLQLNQKRKRPVSSYEKVVLQCLNFQIMPPLPLILQHMQSMLTMIDRILEEVLDRQSCLTFKMEFQKMMEQHKKARRKKKKFQHFL